MQKFPKLECTPQDLKSWWPYKLKVTCECDVFMNKMSIDMNFILF